MLCIVNVYTFGALCVIIFMEYERAQSNIPYIRQISDHYTVFDSQYISGGYISFIIFTLRIESQYVLDRHEYSYNIIRQGC